jgi:hypothetical protein
MAASPLMIERDFLDVYELSTPKEIKSLASLWNENMYPKQVLQFSRKKIKSMARHPRPFKASSWSY